MGLYYEDYGANFDGDIKDSLEFENVRTTSGRAVKIYKNKEEYDHE